MDVEMNSVKYFWCRPCVVEASSLILLPQFKWRETRVFGPCVVRTLTVYGETRGILVPGCPHCVWDTG